jgi:hypothetical protein
MQTAMGRIRTIALLSAALFGALLLIYRFDFGMAATVFVVAAIMGVVFFIAANIPHV